MKIRIIAKLTENLKHLNLFKKVSTILNQNIKSEKKIFNERYKKINKR